MVIYPKYRPVAKKKKFKLIEFNMLLNYNNDIRIKT